jgi:hypothetical protein
MKHRTRTTKLRLLASAVAVSALAACSSTPDSESATASSPTSSTGNPDASGPGTPGDRQGSGTPVTITAGGRTVEATLNDNEVSRDFIETLPVTLPWYRNYDIEYITELTAPMTETGPFYTDVQPGDLVYYNPMDSITIIYEETSSVPTLTKMGEITSDLAVFRELPDNVEMRIELQ